MSCSDQEWDRCILDFGVARFTSRRCQILIALAARGKGILLHFLCVKSYVIMIATQQKLRLEPIKNYKSLNKNLINHCLVQAKP